MKLLSTLIALPLLGLVLQSPADAAARAWVSSTGTDAGNCLVATPCRTFQYAHDHLEPGGEIDVKDPGGYGPININRSISVVADGVLATIGGQGGGFGVNVINTTSTDVVVLRGLTINGTDINGGGGFAISSGRVTIDHCSVKGVSTGVDVSGNAALMITNSIFTGNFFGISIAGGPLYVAIGGNIIANNRYGIVNYSGAAFSYGDNKINGNTSYDLYPSALPVASMR